MDSEEISLFALLYILVLSIFGFIVVKHHSRKISPWLVTSNYDLQHSRLFYILSWLVVIVFTLTFLGFIFPTTQLVDMVSVVGIYAILPFTFVFCAIGIIVFGLAEIIKGEAYFYPGSRVLLPIKGRGLLARIWGFVHFLAGFGLLLLIASFTNDVVCNNQLICFPLKYADKLLSLWEVITKWIIRSVTVFGVISFVYWAKKGFKRGF